MNRTRWMMVMAVILTLASCHRRNTQPLGDSIPEEAIQIADSQLLPETDTVLFLSSKTKSAEYSLHQDTAEILNLRLFARKMQTIYSSTMLVGEWQRDSEYEHYLADGSGSRWDTGDDVNRDEAQVFTWTLDSNLLTFQYKMQMGGLVIRQYIVTYVDDELLVYRDVYGDSFMWDKVPDSFTDRPIASTK